MHTQWLALFFVYIWFGIVVYVTFEAEDYAVLALAFIVLFNAIIFNSTEWPALGALQLIGGVTIGKAAKALLSASVWKGGVLRFGCACNLAEAFLLILILTLAFAALFPGRVNGAYYQGPRWSGFWGDPNESGILMEVGVILSVSLLVAHKIKRTPKQCFQFLIFMCAGSIMIVELLCSYSRGAWAGTIFALIYFVVFFRKFRWIYIIVPIIAAVAVLYYCWDASDSAPWYIGRLNLNEGSVQHRVAAWEASLKIMRDHPFGVGWSEGVKTYELSYMPPQGGAAAIMTNDYLMLGTQAGVPALACFFVYVALCLKRQLYTKKTQKNESSDGNFKFDIHGLNFVQIGCFASVLAMLITFWFDDGLFRIPIALVFWILLEVGTTRDLSMICPRNSPTFNRLD